MHARVPRAPCRGAHDPTVTSEWFRRPILARRVSSYLERVREVAAEAHRVARHSFGGDEKADWAAKKSPHRSGSPAVVIAPPDSLHMDRSVG